MTRSSHSLFVKLSWWAEACSKLLQSSVHTTKVVFQAHVHAVTELYLKHNIFSPLQLQPNDKKMEKNPTSSTSSL